MVELQFTLPAVPQLTALLQKKNIAKWHYLVHNWRFIQDYLNFQLPSLLKHKAQYINNTPAS